MTGSMLMARLVSSSLAVVVACASGCGGGGAHCTNTCASGASQCSGTQVQRSPADSNGCLAFGTATSCGPGTFCSSSTNACVACVNSCSAPGATQCSGTLVQTCAADSNGCLA